MPAELSSILRLEVPVIVVIAQRDMAVKDVMNFAPGAILELPKAADEDLEVMVNNRPIGVGRAVKVGENFGVRVTWVGDLLERIEAMGGEDGRGDDGRGECGRGNDGRKATGSVTAGDGVPASSSSPSPLLATPA